MQLHRLAYEEAGYGEWENCTGILPVTAPGEKLGVLDVKNEKHPKIEHAEWKLRTVMTDETMVDSGKPTAKKAEVQIKRVDSQEEGTPKRGSMCISPMSTQEK